MKNPTKPLTPPEAAQIAGVSVVTVRQWIGNGELQAVNVSRHRGSRPRWRIDEQVLLDFLASRTSQPDPEPVRRRRKRSGSSDTIEFIK